MGIPQCIPLLCCGKTSVKVINALTTPSGSSFKG
jgi:hypothetical protein